MLCKQCQTPFTVTKEDEAFYESVSPDIAGKKLAVPLPSLCPSCRSQRRLAFRNERKLYHRKSDLSGKEFISIYSPEKPYIVYDTDEWWSDKWDPMDYGREVDFSRSFLEQFKELWQSVPMLGLSVLSNEDCGYVNYCGYSKRCYLSYNTDFSENMYYSTNCVRCKDSCDMLCCINSELSYNSTDLTDCYHTSYSSYCFNCSDSYFLIDCKSCQNCFGCVGLRNKSYCYFNEQLTPEDYKQKLAAIDLGSHRIIDAIKTKLKPLYLSVPKLYTAMHNSENISGNYINQSHNALDSFDIGKCEDVRFCGTVNDFQHAYDCDNSAHKCTYCYEICCCGDRINNALFCHNIWSGGSNIIYCVLGSGIQDCFGCIGLRKKQYCILNKQYTKEQYNKLVPKIIEHMITSNEWGEFFPTDFSPFDYNETLAQDYFPLTKESASSKGISWKNDDISNRYQGEKVVIADHINNVPESIIQQILTCDTCQKNYRIISQELSFYRKNSVPLPKLCANCRHIERLNQRNPRQLWSRECSDCHLPLQTTYAPGRPEIILCEPCYLKQIY